MINDDRQYDLRDYNRKQRTSESSMKNLRMAFIVLAGTAVVLGFVLVGSLLGLKSKGVPLTDDGNSQGQGSAAVATIGSISTPTPTVPYTITEYLPENAVADEYWGELEEAENPVPYERFEVRGMYLNAAMNLEQNVELTKNSELNAVVIDLKEADGVYFNSSNELANSVGYVWNHYDLTEVCNYCHENDVWVIGRIVCFKDVNLANAYPDRAICDSTGEPLHFPNEGNEAFVSPYDSRNWDYLIDLAIEAIGMGVDEIQFDYVRFPTGSSDEGTEPYYGLSGEVPERCDAINRFLQTARVRIQDTLGVPVSADIFGIAVTSSLDGDILGQDWETVGLTGVDSLCPMIYPSHYALGTVMNGVTYEYPDKNPYDIMFGALITGSQYHNAEGYAEVRPYLQAFTASYLGEGRYMTYDYTAINDQIRALQDAGQSEFILWNAACEYPDGNYGGNNG